MRVLVTGFEPFGNSDVNPSQLVVERLRALPPGGAEFSFRILPVVYNEASDLLRGELESIRPDLFIGIGQGSGAGLHIERTAVNLNDVRRGRADNAGNSPQDQIAVPESADGHFATIPVRALASYLREQGFPAQVSNSAGTFLCNHVMFAALDFAAGRGFPRQAGFIHTPLLPEQAAALEGDLRPSMALDFLEEAIRASLGWLVEQTVFRLLEELARTSGSAANVTNHSIHQATDDELEEIKAFLEPRLAKVFQKATPNHMFVGRGSKRHEVPMIGIKWRIKGPNKKEIPAGKYWPSGRMVLDDRTSPDFATLFKAKYQCRLSREDVASILPKGFLFDYHNWVIYPEVEKEAYIALQRQRVTTSISNWNDL